MDWLPLPRCYKTRTYCGQETKNRFCGHWVDSGKIEELQSEAE